MSRGQGSGTRDQGSGLGAGFRRASGTSICQTSLVHGHGLPPATQILSSNTYADCSCRGDQTFLVTSCCQSFPSAEYQTSFQFFDGLFDQPPRSHMWSL